MKKQMLKVAAIALFAALFATTANAQSVKYPKMHFGIRLGGTFTRSTVSSDYYPNDNYDIDSKTWFTGGLALDFRVAPAPLYLETGVYYFNRTAEVDGESLSEHTAQLPVLLSYHYYISDKAAVQPFAGVYASEGHEFGYGVRLGVGINYGRLYANVGYDIDLGEHEEKYSYLKFKTPGLFATIGFNFGGSR